MDDDLPRHLHASAQLSPARQKLLAIAFAAIAATDGAHAQTEADEGTVQSMRGCEVRYRVHRASGEQAGPVALIAHGFMRSGEFMDGWAEAFSQAGVTAVTVDLCASSTPQGRHADNGADLVTLRRTLGIEEAIYVGVSA